MPSKYKKNWARTEQRLQRIIDEQTSISSRSVEPTYTRDSENTPQEGRVDSGSSSAPFSQGVLTPLFCADPEFATSTPLPIGPLNFDQVSTDTSHSENEVFHEETSEPNIQAMASIRQQNGTVQGQEGNLRPPNITYP